MLNEISRNRWNRVEFAAERFFDEILATEGKQFSGISTDAGMNGRSRPE
jgi:hypothetical protein